MPEANCSFVESWVCIQVIITLKTVGVKHH